MEKIKTFLKLELTLKNYSNFLYIHNHRTGEIILKFKTFSIFYGSKDTLNVFKILKTIKKVYEVMLFDT